MTVFRAFLKVLNQNKFIIIMYTVILIFFGGFNMTTDSTSTDFVASKPDVLVINNDEEVGLTKNLVEYIQNNTNIIDIKQTEDAINDALFYRDVNYIIYIPEHFREDLLNQKNPQIQVKSTGDYQSSLAEMLLTRYLNIANIYIEMGLKEEDIITNIGDTLSEQTEVEITSKLDTDGLSKAVFYYNFASYSMLAGCVYIICLILSSFKEEKIRKRTIISSMDDKKYNLELLLSNSLFSIILWILYVLLSFFLLGNIMFTVHGLILIINSFLFTICALTIAFLIGNIIHNKNAINGIVNVVALGSSFLCGAFVPMEWLPNSVLTIAHILPSYWYIKTNELIKEMEVFSFETMKTILFNMGILVLFGMLFVVLTNIVSRRKQKIG